jgi:hypothetical protein
MSARQPLIDDLDDPPLVALPVGEIQVTARRARSGPEVWIGAEGGRSSTRTLLLANGEPCLAPAFTRGSRVKPLGGLFAEWTPAGHRNVRVVASDGTILTASSGQGAWITVVSVEDPHHTWIEYVDDREETYLRRRLDSIHAFVGISWARANT